MAEESVTDSATPDGLSGLQQYVPGFEVNNSCEFGVQVKEKTTNKVLTNSKFHLQSTLGGEAENEGADLTEQITAIGQPAPSAVAEPQRDDAYESPQETLIDSRVLTDATENVATANLHNHNPDAQQSTRSHDHMVVTSVRHAGMSDEISQLNCNMSNEAARAIIYEPSTSLLKFHGENSESHKIWIENGVLYIPLSDIYGDVTELRNERNLLFASLKDIALNSEKPLKPSDLQNSIDKNYSILKKKVRNVTSTERLLELLEETGETVLNTQSLDVLIEAFNGCDVVKEEMVKELSAKKEDFKSRVHKFSETLSMRLFSHDAKIDLSQIHSVRGVTNKKDKEAIENILMDVHALLKESFYLEAGITDVAIHAQGLVKNHMVIVFSMHATGAVAIGVVSCSLLTPLHILPPSNSVVNLVMQDSFQHCTCMTQKMYVGKNRTTFVGGDNESANTMSFICVCPGENFVCGVPIYDNTTTMHHNNIITMCPGAVSIPRPGPESERSASNSSISNNSEDSIFKNEANLVTYNEFSGTSELKAPLRRRRYSIFVEFFIFVKLIATFLTTVLVMFTVISLILSLLHLIIWSIWKVDYKESFCHKKWVKATKRAIYKYFIFSTLLWISALAFSIMILFQMLPSSILERILLPRLAGFFLALIFYALRDVFAFVKQVMDRIASMISRVFKWIIIIVAILFGCLIILVLLFNPGVISKILIFGAILIFAFIIMAIYGVVYRLFIYLLIYVYMKIIRNVKLVSLVMAEVVGLFVLHFFIPISIEYIFFWKAFEYLLPVLYTVVALETFLCYNIILILFKAMINLLLFISLVFSQLLYLPHLQTKPFDDFGTHLDLINIKL